MIRAVAGALAAVSLAVCIASPLLYFLGAYGESAYKQILALASLAWFVSATAWLALRAR